MKIWTRACLDLRGNLPWLGMLAFMGAAILCLRGQGRRWWCACGQFYPWVGDANSSHTSQHLFDPYSLTHVLHGVLLCGLLTWGIPRLSVPWRLCLTVAIEALWEVVENSPSSSSGIARKRPRLATKAIQSRTPWATS